VWARVILALVAVVLGGSWWLLIRTAWGAYNLHYTLTETDLRITFGPTTVEIPRADIIKAETMNVTKGRRHFGTALPSLQEGRWSFAETGVIRLYSTSTRPLTVLETPTGKWGISPSDPEAFLQALQSGATGRWDPVPTNAGTASVIFASIIGVLSLVTVLLLLGVERGAAHMKYILDRDALVIHVGWLKTRIPYRQMESVEVTQIRGRPARTFGAAFPGFYWGHFYWKDGGGSVRLYCTRLDPVVLIRTRTGTYGVSPADTEVFVAALSRRRAGRK